MIRWMEIVNNRTFLDQHRYDGMVKSIAVIQTRQTQNILSNACLHKLSTSTYTWLIGIKAIPLAEMNVLAIIAKHM